MNQFVLFIVALVALFVASNAGNQSFFNFELISLKNLNCLKFFVF